MPTIRNIPETQRSWRVVSQGRPSQALKLDNAFPVPSKLKSGEVLVKVQAAALNPVGYKMMRILPTILSSRPLTPEYDLAGIIVDAGDTKFKTGDRVFGMVDLPVQRKTTQGALTQYTRLPASDLVPLPDQISFTGAAGFTLAGLTAWQGLFNVGELEPGQHVFVNGGSSSCGAFAIQIAKAKGCKVTASASGKNEELCKSLGADEFFDYTKAPLYTQLVQSAPSPKYNIIFDAVGLIDPSLFTYSPAYLAPGGVYVSTTPMPSASWDGVKNLFKTLIAVNTPRWLGGTPRKWAMVRMVINSNDLSGFRDLVADGKIQPVVDSVFPFDDVLEAYDRIMSGRAKGKVVIRVDTDAE